MFGAGSHSSDRRPEPDDCADYALKTTPHRLRRHPSGGGKIAALVQLAASRLFPYFM
jgi:hypothetical protein